MLNIDDLIPRKLPVETSIGTLYVRHGHLTDWKRFHDDDPLELGKMAAKQFTSRIEDKRDTEPLSDEDLAELDDSDVQALAPAIAKMNDYGDMPPGSGLEEIGKA